MYSICLHLLRLQFILQGEEKNICIALYGFLYRLFVLLKKQKAINFFFFFFTKIFILFIFLTLATVVN